MSDVAPDAPEPDPVDEPLPEGQDSFPREYVEKLRAEAAQRRTQLREYEQVFEGYEPEERSRYLELVGKLRDQPEAALEEFRGVTERLAKQLGKEFPTMTDAPAPAEEPVSEESDDERIARLVDERLAAEREAREKEEGIKATYAEAEALSDDYKTTAGKAFLFGVAQEMDVSLAEAHEIIQGLTEQRIAERMPQGGGRNYPPRLPAGSAANAQDQGPATSIKEASRRAQEDLAAKGLFRS